MEPTIVSHDVVFSERMSRHLCNIQKWVGNMCITWSHETKDTTTILFSFVIQWKIYGQQFTCRYIWMMCCCNLNVCVYFVCRGDIIIAKSPFDPHMNVCKRVIGLEGDKICTSAPSDLFKTHTYVSMYTSYKPVPEMLFFSTAFHKHLIFCFTMWRLRWKFCFKQLQLS